MGRRHDAYPAALAAGAGAENRIGGTFWSIRLDLLRRLGSHDSLIVLRHPAPAAEC